MNARQQQKNYVFFVQIEFELVIFSMKSVSWDGTGRKFVTSRKLLQT